MGFSRRQVIGGLSAATIGLAGLKMLGNSPANAQTAAIGFGPLVSDPAGLLDLPVGFRYSIVSRTGEPMSDGLLTPAAFDGMAAFAVPGSPHLVALVRNHEIWPNLTDGGAFGPGHALLGKVARERIFDFNAAGEPKLGGTTTLLWDGKARKVVRSHLSLAGTCGNCAGGSTPWGSWLTCEESIENAAPLVSRAHGWVFEVPSAATGLVDPVPLTAMGRFVHEAAIVDPASGIGYLTEDRPDGLFYRFLPDMPGKLAQGGRLQALGLVDDPDRDLRNWPADGSRFSGSASAIAAGQSVAVRWIDLDGVDSPDGDLKERGFAKGALRFARGEGITVGSAGGGTEIYFCCTMGGPAKLGHVWRYRPDGARTGRLELFVESTARDRLNNCDNVTVTPWGGLLLCEDGPGVAAQYLRGVTRDGRLYDLASTSLSEVAGACFSPDGSALFLNVQDPGITFAIEGPWRSLNPRAMA